MTPIEKIQANAEEAVAMARQRFAANLTYDRSGVKWLDTQLNRLAGQMPESIKGRLINIIGSFLGETIVRTYGGSWIEKPGPIWVVEISRQYRVEVNVFGKVEKQLEGIAGESVLGLFDLAPILAETGKAG